MNISFIPLFFLSYFGWWGPYDIGKMEHPAGYCLFGDRTCRDSGDLLSITAGTWRSKSTILGAFGLGLGEEPRLRDFAGRWLSDAGQTDPAGDPRRRLCTVRNHRPWQPIAGPLCVYRRRAIGAE